jgi:hypothetical protein
MMKKQKLLFWLKLSERFISAWKHWRMHLKASIGKLKWCVGLCANGGAGLSMSLESRRTGQPDIISTTTPGPSCAGLGPGYERPNWADGSEMASESDWEPGDDIASELAPDDSASNISSARHRRPKRRNERRTPALVEEEDEDD